MLDLTWRLRAHNPMIQLSLYECQKNLNTLSASLWLFCNYVVCLPILIGFSQELLYYFSISVIWICLLLTLLPERLFQSDLEDGTLELYLISNYSLQTICLSKVLGYWMVKVLALICTLPILSLFYHFELYRVVFITMIIGSLVFTLICAIHSSLALGPGGPAAWSSIQYFTTLPACLPLILLCTSTQAGPLIVLIGYLGLFLWIYSISVSATLRNLISY